MERRSATQINVVFAAAAIVQPLHFPHPLLFTETTFTKHARRLRSTTWKLNAPDPIFPPPPFPSCLPFYSFRVVGGMKGARPRLQMSLPPSSFPPFFGDFYQFRVLDQSVSILDHGYGVIPSSPLLLSFTFFVDAAHPQKRESKHSPFPYLIPFSVEAPPGLLRHYSPQTARDKAAPFSPLP